MPQGGGARVGAGGRGRTGIDRCRQGSGRDRLGYEADRGRHGVPLLPVRDLGQPSDRRDDGPYWHYLRRVMGEVLRDDEKMPGSIWDEHAAILEAVIAGKATRWRYWRAIIFPAPPTIFVTRLQAFQETAMADRQSRSLKRIRR